MYPEGCHAAVTASRRRSSSAAEPSVATWTSWREIGWKRKAGPPPTKTGNKLPPMLEDGGTAGVGSPPRPGMRRTVEPGDGVYRMSSAPHVPPYGEGAFASE